MNGSEFHSLSFSLSHILSRTTCSFIICSFVFHIFPFKQRLRNTHTHAKLCSPHKRETIFIRTHFCALIWCRCCCCCCCCYIFFITISSTISHYPWAIHKDYLRKTNFEMSSSPSECIKCVSFCDHWNQNSKHIFAIRFTQIYVYYTCVIGINVVSKDITLS